MEYLITLYKLLTLVYSMMLLVCWIEKLGSYFVYKNTKFKSLFKFYDLGIIIFPISALMIVFVLIVAFISEFGSKIGENKFFNKNLFK